MTLKDLYMPILNIFKNLVGQNILEKSLDYVSGLEYPKQNPDKLLDDKGKDLKLYDAMMLDDRIASIMALKKRMALAVGGSFVPPSDDPADIEMTDWIEKSFNSMTIRWWDVFENLLDGMIYGFKAGEKIFDLVDGKIVIKNIKFMHSIHFDFEYDKYGVLSKMYIGRNTGSNIVVNGEDIANKFIFYINPYLKDGNYYGTSDLNAVYPLYYSKYQIFRFRNIYLQNYGQPIPIIDFDSQKTSTTEKDEMKDFMDNLQDNVYIMKPGLRPIKKDGSYYEKMLSKFEISLLENTKTTGTDQYEKTLDQLDRQISRRLLVPDKMGFTADSSGARAQADTEVDILKLVIKDLHGRLEDIANAMIKQVIDLNFPSVESYTTWQFEKIDEKIEKEMLTVLLTQGVIDKREKWIRTWVGIPEITQKEQDEIDEQKKEAQAEAQRNMAQQAQIEGRPQFGFPQKKEMKAKEPIDFKKIKEQYDTAEADFVRDYTAIHRDISADLMRQVEKKKIVENKDYKAIQSLRANKGDIKKLLSLYYAKLYVEGKAEALEEVETRLPRARMAVKPPYSTESPHTFLDGEDWLDREWIDAYLNKYGANLSKDDVKYLQDLRQRAFFVTGEIEDRMLKGIYHAIDNGIRSGTMTKTVINQIDSFLAEDRQKYATTIARTNASDAYNTGRMNTFNEYNTYIEAYQYSAILDDYTTDFCLEHDGQIIYASDPQFSFINPPNHYNCRSILIPIFTGEGQIEESPYYGYENREDAWGTGVAVENRLPAAGFGGTV